MKFLSFKSKAFRKSSRFVLITIFAVIITVLLNIAVSFIPTEYTHIDTTYEKLFTLSEQTTKMLKKLNKEVVIYHLCAGGIEDDNIAELLKRYSSISPYITIALKDTSVYPTFAEQYTDVTLPDNSIIVAGSEKHKAVSYYDIYKASSDDYLYYGIYDLFNGESALTSAIDYVINDNLPKIYYTEGHGESDIPIELTKAISQENIDMASLTLNGLEAVPEDADCILMYAPDRDISETEKKMFSDYMSKGGKMLIISEYTSSKMPIFNQMLSDYSITLQNGLVFESDGGNYVPNYPYFIYPIISSHTITDPILNDNLHLLFPLAQGITVKDTPESLVVEKLISSSDTAFSKTDISSEIITKEENDINGPFELAVSVTDSKASSKLVLFSTAQFLDSSVNNAVAGANYDLFLNALGWLCNKESSIAVHSKEMYSTSVAVPENASRILFVLIVIILPAIFITTAIVVTKIRKNR